MAVDIMGDGWEANNENIHGNITGIFWGYSQHFTMYDDVLLILIHPIGIQT